MAKTPKTIEDAFDVLNSEEFKLESMTLFNNLETFWRANVKSFFNKSELNYNWNNAARAHPKFRQHVRARNPNNRLTNAIEIVFNDAGRVRIGVRKIMVKKHAGETDLIEYLVHGTPDSFGRYMLNADSRVPYTAMTGKSSTAIVANKKRVAKKYGVRRGTGSEQWSWWMDRFISQVDTELRTFLTTVEKKIADKVVAPTINMPEEF